MKQLLVLLVVSHLSQVSCEWFSEGEYFFRDLSDQWELLNRWSYGSSGSISLTLHFTPNTDTDIYPILGLYRLEDPESWNSDVLSKTSCSGRLAQATEQVNLRNEAENYTDIIRNCYNYYDGLTCEITKSITKESWVFITLSYCGQNVSLLDLQWVLHSTNGGGFLTNESPLTEFGLFLTSLILLIICIIFAIFWIFYKRTVKLSTRLLQPFRVALLFTVIGLCLFTGYYGRLCGSGLRMDSLENVALLFLLLSFLLIVHVALTAIWAGSTISVRLPRWKSVLTFLLPGICIVAMVTVFAVHYFDVEHADVHVWEIRPDRYLVWVEVGMWIVLWVAATVPFVRFLTAGSSDPDKLYLLVLYGFTTLYLLGIPGITVITNFNVNMKDRLRVITASYLALHTANFLFLFVCIRENHTLRSVGHYWWKHLRTLLRCLSCGWICCRRSGRAAGATGCLGCCFSCCPCFTYLPCCADGRREDCCSCCSPCCRSCWRSCCFCLPCCRRSAGDTDKYNGDLTETLKAHRESFDLHITDATVETPHTVIKSEPVVIMNAVGEQDSGDDSDEFGDKSENDKNKGANKVVPWLISTENPSPPKQEASPRFYVELDSDQNVKRHGYGAPNHWADGNYKPFATAGEKPIVLYKSPDHLKSKSSNSVGKPSTFVPYKNPMARSWEPKPTSTSSRSLEAGDTFDVNAYNNSQIRSGKEVNYTMQYRRDTLKKGLDNIPTALLLQRVPRGAAGTDQPPPIAVKPKIVRVLPKKRDQGPAVERSKSKLWQMLSKKYSGKPVHESLSSDEKLRKVVRAFKVPVRNP